MEWQKNSLKDEILIKVPFDKKNLYFCRIIQLQLR